MVAWRIAEVRAYVIETPGVGGNYAARAPGHWIVDARQANPMSIYPNRTDLRTGGGDAAAGILVEIEGADGTVGIATGSGGIAACAIIEQGLAGLLVGADPRDTAKAWDQMYRTSLPYGRKGVALMAISAVDLALWDLLGRLRGEPVYRLAGGATRDRIAVYGTGPDPTVHQRLGFFGAKVPFPYGPSDGREGLAANVRAIAAHRQAVGSDYPLMVDCFMALDVPYALEFARKVEPYGLYWIEEALHPDDWEGYRHLKAAAPWVRWVTGEHEYTRWGFRNLVQHRAIDIIQPDLMWCGGFTEALRIAALASAFDVTVVPHAGGVYSYHFAMTQPTVPFVEYCNTSPKGDAIPSVFGAMFEGEPLASDGTITLSDAPGWGLTLKRDAVTLRRFAA
ncbi:MAG: L-rhamnonate dehydratase [Alphaproteobacteria bacterium]|nr:L-rhamnonate dehydratase [Alphaproteobacteria bacterium]